MSLDNIMTKADLNVLSDEIKNYVSDRVGGEYTDYTKLLNLPDLSKYALISSVPTKVSDLTNDSGFVTTDEKVTSVETNPSSNTSYNIPFVSGTSNQQSKVNDGLNYTTREGTTASEGISMLELGNSISSGTAKSKYGILRILG